MRNLILAFTAFLFCFSNAACKKEVTFDADYLAFGIYHGECVGNCATLYKMEGQKLYVDDMDYYTHAAPTYLATPLSDAKYQIAAKLINSFPEIILIGDERTYGCPDCADQGGYFLEVKQDGKVVTFHIDTYTADLPAYLVDYAEEIKQVLEDLQ